MKIFNIMLSRDLGGIQQSFLDYTEALNLANHQVTSIIGKNAQIELQLKGIYYCLNNHCAIDLISIYQLVKLLKSHTPQVMITHGKRATNFALMARRYSKRQVIIIGVAHNYSYKSLLKCDYIFSITHHLKNFLIGKNFPAKKIFVQPNMIDLANNIFLSIKENIYANDNPFVTIGTLARLVEKKGIDDFLKALSLLKQQNVNFRAIIGGDGEEYNSLRQLTEKLHLTNLVEFTGWVRDKAEFFSRIDIFCLCSKHEPFGIILLEAMLAGKAIVSTKSEGPSEILIHNQTALLSEVAAPIDLADKIKILSEDKILRQYLASTARLYVQKNYDINVAVKTLTQNLNIIESDEA